MIWIIALFMYLYAFAPTYFWPFAFLFMAWILAKIISACQDLIARTA